MKCVTERYFRFCYPESSFEYLKCRRHPARTFENSADYDCYNGRVAAPLPLPLFLCVPEGSAPQSLDFPVLPRYQRHGNIIKIAPQEFSFAPDAVLQLQYDNRSVEYPLSRRDSTVVAAVTAPHGVVLVQSGGNWYLEAAPHAYGEETKVFSLILESVLSLKVLLDPAGGFERLLEDIQHGRFRTSRREQMSRLLQILRVAREDEEITILSNIRSSDTDFYRAVIAELFSESVLPYMNRNEVMTALSRLGETELRLAFADKEQLQRYAPYFSRNRLRDLQSFTPRGEPVLLWPAIVSYFQAKAALWLPVESHPYRLRATTELGRQLTETMLTEYCSSSAAIRVLYYKGGCLAVALEVYFSELWLFVETSKGIFRRYYFREVRNGLLLLDDLVLRPGLVFAAGFSGGQPIEAIILNLVRQEKI